MSFQKHMGELRHANRKLFAAAKIQLSPDALEVQLRRAYGAGYADALNLAKQISEMEQARRPLFETLFGK
jgi:hypothetical protein